MQLLKFCDFIKFSIFIFCGTEKNEGGGESSDQNLRFSRSDINIMFKNIKIAFRKQQQQKTVVFSALRISEEYNHNGFWGKSSYYFLYQSRERD